LSAGLRLGGKVGCRQRDGQRQIGDQQQRNARSAVSYSARPEVRRQVMANDIYIQGTNEWHARR